MTDPVYGPGLAPGEVPFALRATTAAPGRFPDGEAPTGPMDDEAGAVEDRRPAPSASEPEDDETAAEGPEDVDDAPFAELPAPLREALAARGFESFTPVQRAVLEAVGEGCDLRISSQTGSGKTVALGLAMAEAVLADAMAVARPTRAQRGPVALVIVPTRELAAQVAEELSWLFAEVPGASVDVVTGGTSVPFERRRLARSPRILVGTPGRLLDHLDAGALDLGSVRELVLDEADQMLDMGFRDELEAILDRTNPDRHTHLVSATFPDGIVRLAERYQERPRVVEGTRLGEANADIEHIGQLVRPDQRYDLLVNHLLLAGGERTLVFVNTRAETGELSARLAADGFGAQPLSGELQQAQRTRTLAAFRAGTAPVLVATDVAARGLDVPDVALVVHTAMPLDAEVYTHRSGRTGRAGQRGRSILMVAPSRERRATRMLEEAGIELEWRPLPRAKEVQSVLDRRAEAELQAQLDLAASLEGAPTEGRRALARALLEGRDPVLVVAALLPRAVAAPPATPRDVLGAPEPRSLAQRDLAPRGAYGARDRRGRPREPQRPYARSDERPFDRAADAAAAERPPHTREELLRGEDRRGPDARPGSAPGPEPRARAPRAGGAEFVRFQVNWGFRGGANPRRLLATLCRRGGVTSREIGSIDIGPHGSTFEVAGWAAEAFAERAGRDDPRDPGLWVAPEGPLRGRGPRRR